MTKFSFEVPLHHLLDFDDIQDFHFTLSILFTDTRYQSYQRYVESRGRETWLDNSFNETGEADDPRRLIQLSKQFLFDKVIAPDAMDWDEKKLARAFGKMVGELTLKQVVVVVKSQKERDYLKLFDAKNFAIPFRYRMDKSFRDLHWCKKYHFLGMNTIEEIQALQPPSMDTSLPIKMAMRGLSLDKWINNGQPRIWHRDMPHYYNIELSPDELGLAKDNIIQLKEMVNETKTKK